MRSISIGSWKRWQKVVLALFAATAVAAGYIFWPISEDISHLAGAGEAYDVRILRDTWGAPHVFGQTDADVAFGLAYAHAEDDFGTIQQVLAAAKGLSAQINGPASAPIDYVLHLLRIPETVEAQYESNISVEARELMEAYAAGINRYAGLNEDEALPGLFPVTGRDVTAGFMQRLPLFYGLDQVLQELFADERQREVSGEEPLTAASAPSRSDRGIRPSSVEQLPLAAWQGSNSFSVGPGRSANGETFLAVNSHQPWQGPVAWYEAHLHSEEGWDMVGGTFPGSPLVLHGHNRNLGWAFTVNTPDLIDVFLLEINPDDPNQYWFDGEWRDLEVREVPLKVKIVGRLFWTVKQEALWSAYGPTVRRPHGTYAMRYASMGETGYIEQWLRLNKARNLEEWRAAMADGPIPMFNAGYADREGNIYYLYNGRIPVRSEGYDWDLYLPGDTSKTLWTEYLPFDQLPQVLNPPAGFVQNANSSPFQTTVGPGNPDPEAYSTTLGIETHMTNRALRALELFGADESITAEDFYAYKYDMAYSTESYMAQYIQRIVDAPLPDDVNMQEAVEILRNWDLRTNPDNRGTALAVLTVQPLSTNPNEVTTSTLTDSLAESVGVLLESYGRLDVPWSEVNRLRRGTVDLGMGGGPDVLHAVYGSLQEDGRLKGIAGDSLVLLIAWDAEGNVSSQSIHQFGSATLDEDSPHYSDQAPLFVNRQLKPVWMNEADILANLEREYRPGE